MEYDGRHLQKGDPLPPFSGKPRLFSMRFCPYAERCVLMLNAKKVEYDLVFIDLSNKPEWIFTFNPKGSVPILEYEEGKAIFESSIITSYIDETYPYPALQAVGSLKRAQDKVVVELLSTAQAAYYIAAFNAQAIKPETVLSYHRSLEILQKDIAGRGTTYLAGDKPGYIDYIVWPFLERYIALHLVGRHEFAITEDKYDILIKYMHAMKKDPAIQSYSLEPENHAKYIESRVKGKPDYSIDSTNSFDRKNNKIIKPKKVDSYQESIEMHTKKPSM
ncbi:unnamed protein product [Pieris macdunnoughi]|uniref:Uncharacterized protein n=1 Tax=Pieris macdunnoughi TaxID=345717 RepID=A0A821WEC2_9NEOP|nr:unnamed protein product [Pieris macdunnoughi]